MITALTALVTYTKARFGTDERGATAVEYGLLVALIALVMAVGAAALGIGIDGLFDSATTELGTVAGDEAGE